MSSWRPLVAGTVGVFLIVLAFLAGQLKGGSDPGLRPSGSATTTQATPRTAPNPQDRINPDGATPDLSPPTTHQS
jgi:hypothetical protein